MEKIAALAGVAALGLSAQAFGYSANGVVTFSWATGGTDKSWTSSGANTLGAMSNTTYFSGQTGNNATAYYNADFASAAQCASTIPGTGTLTGTRKYGCRYNSYGGSPNFIVTPAADATGGEYGPSATGEIFVTDTTLTGTLTINATTDEPTGGTASTIGNGSNGYNTRSADGSPFGNVWYGITTAGTYTLNLTGTFTETGWEITGGTARFSDAGALCQQGGFSTPNNILCLVSANAGGHTATQAEYSWGWDTDGSGTDPNDMQQIVVKNGDGSAVVATLSGVLASLTIDGAGNITTTTGEVRRASAGSVSGVTNCGAGAADDHIRWNGSSMSCGTIGAANLVITGTVVPVPAAAWLVAPAILAAGRFARRRKAA